MSTRPRVRADAEAPQAPVNSVQLYVKHRPTTLKGVYGQEAVVKALDRALGGKVEPHSFLFTGPSGTGKTTLARIAASMLGIPAANVVEVDAATNTGIDAMRGILDGTRYHGFGESAKKMFIIDEAHGLSKQAMDAMLKAVEEPPPHVYFALCTTNPTKLPNTLVTRCAAFDLKPLRRDDLLDLLEDVCKEEDWDTPAQFLHMVATACDGSPRQALSMLQVVHACDDEGEVQELLAVPSENPELINLCRALVKNDLSWPQACKTLQGLTEPAETIRIIIVTYVQKCMLGATRESEVMRYADILHEFRTPCNTSDRLAPILLGLSNLIFRD